MPGNGPKLPLDDMSWQYSFEDLDSFKDLPHLINIASQKIKEFVPGALPYFFILQQEFHEYREVTREGNFSIQEDSNLITYLAIRNVIISRDDMADEDFFKQREEEVLSHLFSKEMAVNVIVPVVYRFRLLGFAAVALDKSKRKNAMLTDEENQFLDLLRESLRVNLYAAILIDNRFYELLSLVDLTKRLESVEYYSEIVDMLMELAGSIVNFDHGVYYENDVKKKHLNARVIVGCEPPKKLKYGESVSGFVFKKKKPAIVNNIKDHVFFNELNKEDYITGSVLSIPFITNENNFGVLTICKARENEEFSVDQLYLLRIVSSFISDYMENKQLYGQLEKSYFDTVSSLATALEAKDKYTRGHSERVMKYSIGIARILGVDKETMRDIKYAAILHDIGKIGISEYIITKPGRLTSEEYQVIQSHPMIGSEILSSIEFLSTAKEYVRYHHEKLDGGGYYGKKKGEYPWETGIICIADSYDALTSDRPYRKAIHPELAVLELKRSIGRQFEKEIFDALVSYLKEENAIRQTLPI